MSQMGVRRFGRINWIGTTTLARREIWRFLNVWSQTLMAPLINAGLFLVVFTIAVGGRRGDVLGVDFMTFLAPGIMMMTVIQQSFANSGSSMTSAKVQGFISDTLMPPLSASELLIGYLAGAIARGIIMGAVIGVGIWLGLGIVPLHPLWCLTYLIVSGAIMGGLGLIAGILSNKFDQLSAISNFLVTPLTFLSGTFYSIEALPPVMRTLCHINPVFYMIDGMRFGMIGVSDSAPWLGLLVCLAAAIPVLGLCWLWLRRGYRLKS